MLDLATCGLLHTYLGRSLRGWHGFADEAHRVKTRWGRDYAAFCDEHGYSKVIQVVVRAPVSVIPITDLRRTHAEDSERLNEKLRYGRKRISPGFSCDIISAEVASVAEDGAEVDLHFHLAARASLADCFEMKRYFEHASWSWWDSLTGGSEGIERYPGALASYDSKGLAEAIRRASSGDNAFSPGNLAELHRQTRRIAMTRASGSFRIWKGEMNKAGLVVIENADGHVAVRPKRKLCTLPRQRDALFTTTGARLLRLTLHDFGDGELRPAIRVRGRQGISFQEVSETYDVSAAVDAARWALLKENTTIPESSLDDIATHPQLSSSQPLSPPLASMGCALAIPW